MTDGLLNKYAVPQYIFLCLQTHKTTIARLIDPPASCLVIYDALRLASRGISIGKFEILISSGEWWRSKRRKCGTVSEYICITFGVSLTRPLQMIPFSVVGEVLGIFFDRSSRAWFQPIWSIVFSSSFPPRFFLFLSYKNFISCGQREESVSRVTS